MDVVWRVRSWVRALPSEGPSHYSVLALVLSQNRINRSHIVVSRGIPWGRRDLREPCPRGAKSDLFEVAWVLSDTYQNISPNSWCYWVHRLITEHGVVIVRTWMSSISMELLECWRIEWILPNHNVPEPRPFSRSLNRYDSGSMTIESCTVITPSVCGDCSVPNLGPTSPKDFNFHLIFICG